MGKKEIFQSAKEAVAEWKEREGETATLASFLSMLQVVVVVFSFHDSGITIHVDGTLMTHEPDDDRNDLGDTMMLGQSHHINNDPPDNPMRKRS